MKHQLALHSKIDKFVPNMCRLCTCRVCTAEVFCIFSEGGRELRTFGPVGKHMLCDSNKDVRNHASPQDI